MLSADSHRFGPIESALKLLTSATLRAGDGQSYLALAHTDQVDLRQLLPRGKIGTDSYGPWEPPPGDEVFQLAPLAHENGDRLLVLTARGRLFVLEPEVHENEQVLIAKLELGTKHRASAMAIVPGRDGTFTVAIASYPERRSELTLVGVQDNRLIRSDPLPLDLPRAEMLDLSTDGKGGYWLMAGAKHGTRVLLRRLSDADAPCRMRVLQSGTLALRFSEAEDPGYAVYGGLSGLLWCVGLKAEGSACDLAWTYRLQGAIRSIERLHIYEEAHFLVGTESGELCLLRARDGRRIWKGRVQAPVRHVVAREQPEPLVLVVMPRGLVASFNLITETDRPNAWDTFEGYLQTLQGLGVAHDDDAWNDPDAGGVKAFYELKCLGHSMIEVVASHEHRESRARLVRYLAEHPADFENEFEIIAGKLSFRDLTLLLSCLPDEFTGWDQTIRNELWRRNMSKERGDGFEGRRHGRHGHVHSTPGQTETAYPGAHRQPATRAIFRASLGTDLFQSRLSTNAGK